MAKADLLVTSDGRVIEVVDRQFQAMQVEVLEGAPVTEHVLANVDLPAQCLIAAVDTSDRIQEVHQLAYHAICQLLEEELSA